MVELSVRTALASAALFIGAGCGSPASGPVGGAWGTTTVSEELSIGVEYGADEYMLGGVRDIGVGADGRIYLSTLQPRLIREYDAEGNHVRDIGREGQGPGEYQSPAIEVTPDDRLVAWDLRNSRVSLYSRKGEFQGSVMIDGSLGGARTFRLDTDGNYYILDWKRTETPVASEADIPRAWDRYTNEGELVDSIPVPLAREDGRALMLREGFESFPIRTVSAWSRLGYLVTGRSDRYEIELRKPSGTILIGRQINPAELVPEERDQWRAFHAYTTELNEGRFEFSPIPSIKPFFSDLEVGDDGRIWVKRFVEAIERDDIEPMPERPDRPMLTWRESPTYDVFEPDGTFLGTVVLPHDFTAYVFRGDHVWGVHLDAGGVERVLRLRVVQGGQ